MGASLHKYPGRRLTDSGDGQLKKGKGRKPFFSCPEVNGTGRRGLVSWALYDWANSAYAAVVMAGFFPVFFKEYWSESGDPVTSTFWLGAANSASGLVMLVSAPILGAIADAGARKKDFLAAFILLGTVSTAFFVLVPQGAWPMAGLLFILATMGFMEGNTFYDSLLIDVYGARSLDTVSALGFAMGYLGGGLLLALCVAMAWRPDLFGLNGLPQAVKTGFLLVSIWWFVFSIPLFVFVRESGQRQAIGSAVRQGLARLVSTLQEIRSYRTVVIFLAAYWLYIDGVDTVVRMAVDYGLALGFRATDLLLALLITQFVGFPASFAFGWIGCRIGAKWGIFLGLFVYGGITIWGCRMESAWEFYAIAVVIGLVQGGVQLLSRSFYARIIPPDRAAEFFGFYNMLGKFAAVIGPFLVGWISSVSGSNRMGILSLLFLFISGAVLLLLIRAEGPLKASRSP